MWAIAFASVSGANAQEPAGPSAAGGTTLEIQEWPVPWERTRPRDPAVAPDGTIWFVGQVGNYVGHLDPETGEMERYEIPETGPHTVIVDEEGYPWYAGNRAGHIGRLDPETGDVTQYEMPDGVRDPHTMGWTSDGDIWFTVQASGPAGYVGKLFVESGEVKMIEVPGQGMRPYGLVVDNNDRPWIAFMGDNSIGTVDPETMELELIETPSEGSRIRRIGIASDTRVWWVDAALGFVGVYDPADQSMEQWLTPGGERAGLYAMAVDNKDRIWYAETRLSPNRLVGFDPETESFFSINEVPSGGGSVRNMVFDEKTRSLWFGTDANTIGRAKVP